MQIKKVVYKNRIRLKEFLVDFDKVRPGTIPEEACHHKHSLVP